MQADALTATTGRRFGGRVRAAILSGAVIAALVAIPASTLAAKAPGGASGAPFIALSTVNGSFAATTHPALGSAVAFSTGYPTGTKNPWVSVSCWQNGVMVYGEGNSPSSTFTLGGASSAWVDAGGAATCRAELGDLYWRGGKQYYTFLATTSFDAN